MRLQAQGHIVGLHISLIMNQKGQKKKKRRKKREVESCFLNQRFHNLLLQVAKTIQGLIPTPMSSQNEERKKELEEMEKQKMDIDKEAEMMVRRELWCGLGLFMAQTLGFMRLTFWELSWDVMEPICFYVTSIYFMAGYSFFLRTSREPSFEGFFQSRFLAKQKRLMKIKNFDAGRYFELRRACLSDCSSSERPSFTNSMLDDSERMPLGSLHN